jgi:hypothetical protein
MEYSAYIDGAELKDNTLIHATCRMCGKQESMHCSSHKMAQFWARELRQFRGWAYGSKVWFCPDHAHLLTQPISVMPAPKLRVTLTFDDGTMVGQGDVDFAYLMELGETESPSAVSYTASLIWLKWIKSNAKKFN